MSSTQEGVKGEGIEVPILNLVSRQTEFPPERWCIRGGILNAMIHSL